MAPSLEAITTAALSAALDIAGARHAAIAANIAQANVEGFVPARPSFEAQLAQARDVLRERGWLDAFAIDALHAPPQPQDDAGVAAAPVQIDLETMELARNALHFQALTQGLSRHLSLLALAAADGRK